MPIYISLRDVFATTKIPNFAKINITNTSPDSKLIIIIIIIIISIN